MHSTKLHLLYSSQPYGTTNQVMTLIIVDINVTCHVIKGHDSKVTHNAAGRRKMPANEVTVVAPIQTEKYK